MTVLTDPRLGAYEELLEVLRDEAPEVLSQHAIERIRGAAQRLVGVERPGDPAIAGALGDVSFWLAARAAARCNVRTRIRRLLEACAPNFPLPS
jgi:hypothetical protein